MHDGWNGIEINHGLIYVRYVLDNRSFLPFVNESSMSLPPLSPVRVAGVAKNNHHIIIVSSTTNKNIIKKLESKYITEYPKGTPFIVVCEKGI